MPLYVRQLPGAVEAIIDKNSVPPNQVLFNPSYAHPMLYLRCTRHTAIDETNYAIIFNVDNKHQHVVDNPMHMLAPNVNLFKGIEDLRICWFEGKLWFAGTTTHATDRMTNELIVGYFNDSISEVERMCPIDIGSFPVKNVCPFIWRDRLHLLDVFKKKIYQLYEVTDEHGKWKTYNVTPIRNLVSASGVSTENYRGSTSPIHLHGNTWGCIVHDIIFNDNTKLVTRLSYLHHWMEFDIETGAITYISSPFWVAHWGIEYVSGIYKKPDTDTIVLYVGVNDRMPVTKQTSLHDLRVGK